MMAVRFELTTNDPSMFCRRRHLFVKVLVRWAKDKRLTNRLPNLSLITYQYQSASVSFFLLRPDHDVAPRYVNVTFSSPSSGPCVYTSQRARLYFFFCLTSSFGFLFTAPPSHSGSQPACRCHVVAFSSRIYCAVVSRIRHWSLSFLRHVG